MTNHLKADQDNEESFKILREIGANPSMTQRELSARLGLSLGKINFLVKALIEKGHVKAENFKNSHNKSAYLYFLTPQGIEAKSRATYRFLLRKLQEYEQLEEEIKQLRLEAEATDKPPGIDQKAPL